MLKRNSLPILRELRNSLPRRCTQAWRFGLCWCALWASSLPRWQATGFTPIVNGTTNLPIELSQVLPHPAVRLAVCPAPPFVNALIPDPMSLIPYIGWFPKLMATRVFGSTKEHSYASL